jgi:acyl carrier protein
MDIGQRVREFITSNFYVADAASLTNEMSLLDQGIVDSTGVLEVIAFLEGEFGFRVDDEEMLPDNLDSIEKIAAFVRRKQGGA